MKLRKPTPQDVLAAPPSSTQLPTHRPIAIYYRQSTDTQVGNISTSMQTVDMAAFLMRYGWQRDRIIMIDMDAGISGSTKIDERPGMRHLFDLITQGKIGAVACQDEDRLFRDVTQIQVNIFIEACRSSHVLVLTPSMVYDFANELTGTFHARQFRFKSEMAAEYINAVIRGRLHRAKRRIQLEGRWGGGGTPPGYMVDMRKILPDGSKNENWRRYVPFEPYAQVIQEYFHLFLEHAGNVRATVRYIEKYGPYYPDPTTCQLPDGFKMNLKVVSYNGRYRPGRTGLVSLLTNVAYIGHWAVNDAIVHWDNHEPIVDTDVFMQAFNYLSEVGLDGHSNTDYQPLYDNARPSREEEREVERPLCSGMIVSEDDGQWRTVGTNWVSPAQHYTYVLWAMHPKDSYVWGKRADYVDDAVIRMVIQKLQATFDPIVWEETIRTFGKSYAKERRRLEAQLHNLERVLENLITSLESLNNPNMIYAAEKRYENAQAEQARLMAQLQAMEDEAQVMRELTALKASCGPMLENWPYMTRDEKRIVLKAFIHRIEATPVEGHGLHLRVYWKDNSEDQLTLPRQSTTGTNWLPEETELLLYLVDSGAGQVEIARAFPDRRWTMIRNKYWSERGNGKAIRFRPKPIKDSETYYDYLERTEESSDNDDDDSSADLGSEDGSETKRPDEPGKFRQGGARLHPRLTRHN